ncbi:MAG: DUF4215 domain-containing protein [bacterium]|nr:DUF4215 domain-containing protein [bacterium]
MCNERELSVRFGARRLATVLLAVLALIAPVCAGADTDYAKGPDPTVGSLLVTGPYATASVSVPSSVAGFGGGVIYYPLDTSEGTYGAVVFAPGFLANSSHYSWLGERIASHGFVVFLINTNGPLDNAVSRGQQILAARTYLLTSSAVTARLDPARLAVAGHSMGGGGSLEAAKITSGLRAVIPMQPFNSNWTNWNGVTAPTLIIGSDGDTTAPVGTYAIPFFDSIPGTTQKAYIELRNALHREPVNTAFDGAENPVHAMYTVVWLKVFVDDDARYAPFLCPNPGPSDAIRDFRIDCPSVPTCGDGVVAGDEACDDGGTLDGDGCSSTCTLEAGWSCTGTPSACEPTCGDELVVGDEECDEGALNGDPSACCTASCSYRLAGETCRPAAGDCDLAEHCTGSSGQCPDDAVAPATTLCRPAAGDCDLAEHCTGSSGQCPDDIVAPATTLCRPAAGDCDLAEHCTGAAVACPPDTGLPDTDGDTVCDALDNCVDVANPTQADGDGDAQGDACDPCTNLVPTVGSKSALTLDKLLPPAGDDKLSFTSFFAAVPGTADIDPLADGVRFLIVDATGALPVDVTIPGGAYVPADKAGWKVNARATVWTYKNAGTVVPAVDGIITVQIKRDPAKPGTLKVKVVGKNGGYAVDPTALPLVPTIVLDPPVAETGRCGEAAFPNTPPAKPSCAVTGGGKTIKCR